MYLYWGLNACCSVKLGQTYLVLWIAAPSFPLMNTKYPPSDIWLLRYKQTGFWFFGNKQIFNFFKQHRKLFCLYLSNQILLRGCFLSKRTAGYPLSTHTKTIPVAFLKLSNRATKKRIFENFKKAPNYWCMVRCF